MARVNLVHVPYRGGTLGITAVLSGEVEMLVGMISTILPQVEAGRARAIAVTGTHRAAPLPNVPTVAEAGISGYETTNWYGLFAPGRTPQNITDQLYKTTKLVLGRSDVRDMLMRQGIEPEWSNSPEQFAEFLRLETEKWRKVVHAAKLGID